MDFSDAFGKVLSTLYVSLKSPLGDLILREVILPSPRKHKETGSINI